MKRDNFFFITENIDCGKRHNLDWVEDNFVQGSPASATAGFLTLSLGISKLKWLLILFLIGLGLLIGKAGYLQVVKGQYYFALAENNRIRTDYVKAPRGVIYDRNNNPLVQNLSGFSLIIVPANLPKDMEQRSGIITQVASFAQMDVSEVNSIIDAAHNFYFQPLVVKTGINYEEALKLKIKSAELPGVSVETDSWRKYLTATSTSHVMGYIGKISAPEYDKYRTEYLLSDNIGKSGIEKQYEALLRGIHGQTRVEVDSLGRPKKIVAQTKAVSGSDILLTIDAKLQDEIYRILTAHLKDKYGAVVVVSNPQNGEVLALVDYPSYDNNLFTGGISHDAYNALLNDKLRPLFARSFLGEYPSGSTIKPVVAAAALEQKIVTRNTSFLSSGGLRIGQWTFPDWKGGGHGTTNVVKAIAESVNTYFYYVGGGYGDFVGLGVEQLGTYFRKFGLGESLGIDLPSEQDGFVPTEEWKQEAKGERWYIGDTYHLSIGQGDLTATPLQMNSVTATIANGGTLYRPRLLKEIIHPDGQHEAKLPQVITEQVVDPGVLQIVREGMRETVLSGSARSLQSIATEVAGKTGTAQWNSKEKNHAWFTAFAPYENPQVAITVLVEAGGEGSSIAVPIARDVLNYIFPSPAIESSGSTEIVSP
jgi:penicillin-binding protein 2